MTDPGPGGELRNTLYKTVTRSGRRMTRARRLLYAVAVPIAVTMIRLWWLSCRVRRIDGGCARETTVHALPGKGHLHS